MPLRRSPLIHIPLAYSGPSGFNPAASTLYYFGFFPGSVPTTSQGADSGVMPMGGTIVRADITLDVVGVLSVGGANMSMLLRVNNTTDYTLVSGITWSALLARFSGTGLAIPINPGDYIEAKFTTPAWSTLPTVTLLNMNLSMREAI